MIIRPSRKVIGFAASALVIGGLALGSFSFQRGTPDARPAATAWAEDVMKFEPVPAESVTAMEHRRTERRERDAERRAAETAHPDVPAAPDKPDTPEPPEPPQPPEPPEFSHAGDVVRIGSDIHIEKGQVVEGDVFALRGDIVVDGHVKGNVAATGGNVSLGSTARIDGDVMCIGGKLEEEEGARVLGQRVTALRSGVPRERIREAIRGELERYPRRSVGHLAFAMSWLLFSLLLAWGIGKFAPNRTQVAVDLLRREPGMSLAIGVGLILMLVPSVVALALVVAILCITIIGIPLALGVIVAYAGLLVVLMLWGGVVGVMPIGQRITQRLGQHATPVAMAVWGILLVSGLRVMSEVFRFLPLFGWFGKLLAVLVFVVGTVATLMGAGALLRTKFGQGREGRWWPLFSSQPSPAVPPEPTAPSPPPPPPPPAGPGEPSPAA